MALVFAYFQFILQTRTEVTVNFERYKSRWHDVKVLPAIEDYGHTEGLCGYISTDGEKVEPRLRNGAVENDFAKFADNWQVNL